MDFVIKSAFSSKQSTTSQKKRNVGLCSVIQNYLLPSGWLQGYTYLADSLQIVRAY